jgi:hypothetical protein
MRNHSVSLATLVLCALSLPAFGQEAQTVPDTTPLAITVLPAPAAKGQSLQFVTMTLTNTSDREVRLPEPAIGCASAASGSVELKVTPQSELYHPCTSELAAPASWKKWITLQPGETANFAQIVTPMLPRGAGTFEVRGTYTPPQLSAAQAEELYRDSVTHPTEALTSAAAKIVRDEP